MRNGEQLVNAGILKEVRINALRRVNQQWGQEYLFLNEILRGQDAGRFAETLVKLKAVQAGNAPGL
jgi:hypothetical protein